MFGFAILFFVFNMIVAAISAFLFGVDDLEFNTQVFLSAKEDIVALMSTYGFWLAFFLVSIVVPVYEEVMFRGIILGSVEKKTGFLIANILQSVLFAVVHFDLKRAIFYFLFAFIVGYAVKKTRGLLTGIIFHGVHNFFVLLAIYYMSKTMVFD